MVPLPNTEAPPPQPAHTGGASADLWAQRVCVRECMCGGGCVCVFLWWLCDVVRAWTCVRAVREVLSVSALGVARWCGLALERRRLSVGVSVCVCVSVCV